MSEAKLTLTGEDAALIIKKDGAIELLLPSQHPSEQVYDTTMAITVLAFVATKHELMDVAYKAMLTERGNTRAH